MESKIKIHSIVIALSIFAFALIAVVEMPNIFENVLAQQPEEEQQVPEVEIGGEPIIEQQAPEEEEN